MLPDFLFAAGAETADAACAYALSEPSALCTGAVKIPHATTAAHNADRSLFFMVCPFSMPSLADYIVPYPRIRTDILLMPWCFLYLAISPYISGRLSRNTPQLMRISRSSSRSNDLTSTQSLVLSADSASSPTPSVMKLEP